MLADGLSKMTDVPENENNVSSGHGEATLHAKKQMLHYLFSKNRNHQQYNMSHEQMIVFVYEVCCSKM
jgi:hypothetical protein